jgi:single-stranded-DNA-specific exonuclease
MTRPLKPIVEREALLSTQVHDNPIINRILQNRGVTSMADMEYALSQLIDPFTMMGMKGAVKLLEKHLRRDSRMVVVGDFDCDGATSTSIAVAGLRMMGANNVHFIIPDRVIHGYGLTPPIVKLAAELEPDLIITVDNGIASYDGAKAVYELSRPCELLITDHHLPGEKGLPKAEEIVNPNQHNCPFPSKNLAGCGVMFYVIMALRAHLRDVGYFEQRMMNIPPIATLLDLVALGTVADVVPLDKNNRILIDAGLARIRMGQGRPGIQALLEVAKRDPQKVLASDMGFSLGPRINAAGRLDDMTIGIQCLLSPTYEEGVALANRLNDLNQERRDIEADQVKDAVEMIESQNLEQRKGLVLFEPTWNPGVVGILASRIKDRWNRPVICMTDSKAAREKREQYQNLIAHKASKEEIDACHQELLDCEVKGSARSIDGIHLKHLLDHIAKQHPEILTKFGGHAMAAGLGVKYKHLERFMELFDAEVAKEITSEQMLGTIVVDIKNVPASALSMDMAHTIRKLGPWGQKFPEPNFHARFQSVKEPRIMQGKHAKFWVSLPGSNEIYEAVAFNCMRDGELPVDEVFDAAFSLDINEYRGKQTLQLMLREIQQPEYTLKLDMPTDKQEIAEVKAATPVEADTTTPLFADPKPSVPAQNTSEASNVASSGEESIGGASSKIAGLKDRTQNTPVAKMRADLNSMLDMLKNGESPAAKKHVPPSTDPAPF